MKLDVACGAFAPSSSIGREALLMVKFPFQVLDCANREEGNVKALEELGVGEPLAARCDFPGPTEK